MMRSRLSAAFVSAAVVGSLAFAVSPTAASAVPPDGDLSSAIAQLDGIVADLMARSGVPGVAVSVVHGDEVLYAKGFGVRDVMTGLPVTADTVFQLASVSKPVGASVVAAAVGRGIVAWDDPVQKSLPSFELSDPYVSSHATIGDMYAMRSGLPDAAGDLLELVGFNRAEILRRLRYVPLEPFRTTYAYSDFSLTAGAQAVAVAAKRSWATLSDQLVYAPLGMTSTSSRYSDFLARANRASLHVPDGTAWTTRYVRDPEAQSPAGGVSSNVIDLASWMSMELGMGTTKGREVVAGEPLAEANTAQIRRTPVMDPASLPDFYGYGMNINPLPDGRMMLSHSGAFTAGGGTNVTLIPQSGLGIAVLTNAHAGLAESIAASFVDVVQTGVISRDWWSLYSPIFAAPFQADPAFADAARPVDAAASRPTNELVGRYANDFYGTAWVVAKHGRLALVLGPDHVAIPLEPWSGDRYRAVVAIENAPLSVWVDFAGSDAKAASLTLGISGNSTDVLARVS